MWTSPLAYRKLTFNIIPLVGTSGLEPPTSRLSGVRSNHLSYAPMFVRVSVFLASPFPFGGDEEDRTPDPLRARQVLSQLSYTPISGLRITAFTFTFEVKLISQLGPSKSNNVLNTYLEI